MFFLVFCLLLLLKLGVYPRYERVNWQKAKAPSTSFEHWMEITQGGKTIGLSQRSLNPEEGGYLLKEEVVLNVKTLGVPQEIKYDLEGRLDENLALKNLRVAISSPLYQTRLEGEVRGTQFVLRRGDKDIIIPIKAPPLLPGEVCQKWMQDRVTVFDPLGEGVREAEVKYEGEEKREIMGKKEKLFRLRMDYGGVEETLWCNERGEIAREEGPLGLVVERVSRERVEKLRNEQWGGVDLTRLASIPADVEIREPSRLHALTCRLEGIELEGFFLHGDRQKLQGRVLNIEREDISKPKGTDERRAFPSWALSPTSFIQPTHPQIMSTAKKIVKENGTIHEKAQRIINWAHREIEKWPVPTLADSVSILSHRRGDCTELAILVAAIGRSIGIPTAVETGLVYQEGRFYYHAWNAFYFKELGWITADAVFNQFPADCTHLRFTRGDLGQEIFHLSRLMGKLKIFIREMKYDRP